MSVESVGKNNDVFDALGQIPGGLFVLTAAFEGRRSAVLVRWAQPCSTNPPMVMVALATGQPVEPLIRDSRFFTLSQIGAEDRFLIRKFNGNGCHSGDPAKTFEREPGEDPLLTLMTRAAPSGGLIIDRALCFLDCEVVRHVELDADHRIYVGQVHQGRKLNAGTPAVHHASMAMNGSGNGNGHGPSSNGNGHGGAGRNV